jgi:predicted nuclease with TOPRIM domain
MSQAEVCICCGNLISGDACINRACMHINELKAKLEAKATENNMLIEGLHDMQAKLEAAEAFIKEFDDAQTGACLELKNYNKILNARKQLRQRSEGDT